MTYDWRHVATAACLGWLACWLFLAYAYRHWRPPQARCPRCQGWLGRTPHRCRSKG